MSPDSSKHHHHPNKGTLIRPAAFSATDVGPLDDGPGTVPFELGRGVVNPVVSDPDVPPGVDASGALVVTGTDAVVVSGAEPPPSSPVVVDAHGPDSASTWKAVVQPAPAHASSPPQGQLR
ncbi:hypothetical protein ACHAP6_002767 [Verticillium nonalfalfae]